MTTPHPHAMNRDKLIKLIDEYACEVANTPANLTPVARALAIERIGRSRDAIIAELAKPAHYDQTALELCETCGWKTLIPGEGCLNCERSSQPAWQDEPICAGVWVCDDACPEDTQHWWLRDCAGAPLPALVLIKGARWYGPLPADARGYKP